MKNKYHNKKVFYGDILFDSKKECNYFYKLKRTVKNDFFTVPDF